MYSVARILIVQTFLLVCTMPVFAQQIPEAQNDRAKALFSEIRCVVCQNQSIGESDADVARDLREIVTEQLIAGKSNREIKEYLIDRYGEFVLLRPVFARHTLLLWTAPFAILLLGGLMLFRLSINKQPVETVQLSQGEERELDAILKGD